MLVSFRRGVCRDAFSCDFRQVNGGDFQGSELLTVNYLEPKRPLFWMGSRYMGVSENNGTPISSILIGFSIINHPFWGTPIFGNTHIMKIEIDIRGERLDRSG